MATPTSTVPAGTQVPTAVIEAIADAYRGGLGNVGGAFPASARSDAIVRECRQAVARPRGRRAERGRLGPNMTSLTYRFSSTLSSGG